jgi:hypothetical protein
MTQTLLTAVLVLITLVYAWSTYRIQLANENLVRISHEQLAQANRPYIVASIDLLPHNPIFYLHVRNTGRTAAQDLRLAIDHDFFQFGENGSDRNLATFRAFNEPFDSFPPDAALVFPLAQSFVVFGEHADLAKTPTRFTITATYHTGSQQVTERHPIDLRPYFMSSLPVDPFLTQQEDMVKALKAIQIVLQERLPTRA